MPGRNEEHDVVDAVRAENHTAFAELVGRYRPELQVHCYRMLGSFEDSEDQVQETYLRAWRNRDTFQGRSTFRAWLYRIATNVCLDLISRRQRDPAVPTGGRAARNGGEPPLEISWLQPYPDHLLDLVAPGENTPDARVVAKETIELAFLATLQHLTAKQRAAVILCDVLGSPAGEAASLLDTSTASVTSALQRARATLRARMPARRLEWAPASDPTEHERALLRRYMDVYEHADVAALTELFSDDARLTMPPLPNVFQGRQVIIDFIATVFDPQSPQYSGQWRRVPTSANRQPALAAYTKLPHEPVFRAQLLEVFRIEDGRIAEITTFSSHLFGAFDLPGSLLTRIRE